MSVTNRIQCYSFESFDLFTAIQNGVITLSTDGHIVILDYDVDNLGVSSIIDVPNDPTEAVSHGILHYNTQNGKIYFCDGIQFLLVGVVLPCEGVNVKTRNITYPPTDAVEGDQYLVSGFPDAIWASQKYQIAQYVNAGWEFSVPELNQIVGVEDEFADYTFNGYSWVKQTSTVWIQAIGLQLQDNGTVIPVLFSANIPGPVYSITSGSAGITNSVARSDHSHSLGIHPHADGSSGGQVAHNVLAGITPNDHHHQIHTGLDHTGIIGIWAQIDFTGSSLADIQNKSHTLLTDIGENTHTEIDSFMVTHDHDGVNSAEIAVIDGGSF